MISSSIEKWGVTKNNEQVLAYNLRNDFLEITILNYGGIIQKILMSNKDGKKENIVLGFDDIASYEERSPFFGAIIGRTAGRIKNGELIIKGKKYQLEKNNFDNNLHGYPEHYSNKIWNGRLEEAEGKLILILKRNSPHLEANYPGNVDFTIKYILEKNKLTLEYFGVPDSDTYINLTNHTYFNLSGNCKENIGNQIITLLSDEYLEVDEQTIPIRISKVENSIFDLRNGKSFNEIFNSKNNQVKIVNNGIDHAFIFSNNKNNNKKIYNKNIINAKCYDKKTGRTLEVLTTEPVVILYTGNYLDEVGKISKGIICKKHFGFCLETQDYPDVLKFIPQKGIVYNSSQHYYQKTTFIFKNIIR